MYILFGNLFCDITYKVREMLKGIPYEFIDIGSEEGREYSYLYKVDCVPFLIYEEEDFRAEINIFPYYTQNPYSKIDNLDSKKFLKDVREFIKKYEK